MNMTTLIWFAIRFHVAKIPLNVCTGSATNKYGEGGGGGGGREGGGGSVQDDLQDAR